MANELKVVVATSALGMGFDKPDLTFVVTTRARARPSPTTSRSAGPGGRSRPRSVGVLLAGREDVDIQDWFIRTAFPPREQMETVVALLADAAQPVTMRAIEAQSNVRHGRLELMLKVLEVVGAVERSDQGWRRMSRPWAYDARPEMARVAAARRTEQTAMGVRASGHGCRMAFLRRQLDDIDASDCGRCDHCRRWSLSVSIPARRS